MSAGAGAIIILLIVAVLVGCFPHVRDYQISRGDG
jgi:hypothetical protein